VDVGLNTGFIEFKKTGKFEMNPTLVSASEYSPISTQYGWVYLNIPKAKVCLHFLRSISIDLNIFKNPFEV
jgi:hypothetical protein